jgi:hypothetical protein
MWSFISNTNVYGNINGAKMNPTSHLLHQMRKRPCCMCMGVKDLAHQWHFYPSLPSMMHSSTHEHSKTPSRLGKIVTTLSFSTPSCSLFGSISTSSPAWLKAVARVNTEEFVLWLNPLGVLVEWSTVCWSDDSWLSLLLILQRSCSSQILSSLC